MELTKLTYAMIKPDAVSAHSSGKIIELIENNGFEIVRMQKVMIDQELAEEFYAEHKEKPFFGELVEFITSGPVIILALHKENAIASWRELIGATDPKKAELGTVRYMFGTDIGKNAVHGSLDCDSAVRELELFFPDMFSYGIDEDEKDDSDDECCDDEECDECDE